MLMVARRLALLVCFLPLLVPAASISLTDAGATYSATATNCTGFGGPWTACGANGYLSYGTGITSTEFFNFSGFNNPGGAGEETFTDSFNAFAGTAAGAGWTLNTGAALDLTYSVSTFRTFATSSNGGVEIQVDISLPVGSTVDISTLFWSQALAVNYKVQDAAGVNHSPPVLAMDSFSFNLGGSAIPPGSTCSDTGAGGKAYCDPLYPFQYGDRHFYDKPTGLYPIDSFRGIAMLSSVDFTNKVLTVYPTGVSYGFDLWVVPEPGTYVMISAGLAAIIVLRKRRKQAL
jgi:hypothetical protein